VARALDASLDVIMVRKLGVPFQPELGMGAIGEDGVRILNQDVIERGGISARIGGQFVRRAQPQQPAASTAHLAAVLATGRSLVVWPEGALDPAPGLRPFHLGAFEAAATTGAPVLPAGIRGSRELLRPGSRFPHRAALHVAIGDLIPPAGAGWHAALAPRDQARAAVLALSGEPDTGGPGHTHAAVSTPAAAASPRRPEADTS
jgi:hypothetical protein